MSKIKKALEEFYREIGSNDSEYYNVIIYKAIHHLNHRYADDVAILKIVLRYYHDQNIEHTKLIKTLLEQTANPTIIIPKE